MKRPKSIEELAQHIVLAVDGYMDEGRSAALAAMERAFGSSPSAPRRSSVAQRAKEKSAALGVRRSGKELADLRSQLCELVRKYPGDAMAKFATELGMSARELHLPMSALKREGRVRAVGQRHLTRYFPAVGATVSAST